MHVERRLKLDLPELPLELRRPADLRRSKSCLISGTLAATFRLQSFQAMPSESDIFEYSKYSIHICELSGFLCAQCWAKIRHGSYRDEPR